jgi:hypothetical protein
MSFGPRYDHYFPNIINYVCVFGYYNLYLINKVNEKKIRIPDYYALNTWHLTGCSEGCVFDLGFTCTGDIGANSTCTAQCGDSIRASTEQCDNGNNTG